MFDPAQLLDSNGVVVFDPAQLLDSNGVVMVDPAQLLDSNGVVMFDPAQLLDSNGVVMFDPAQLLDSNQEVVLWSKVLAVHVTKCSQLLDAVKFCLALVHNYVAQDHPEKKFTAQKI